MKWSLQELNKYRDDKVEFSKTIDVEASIMSREKEVLALAPVKVAGFISVTQMEYIAHFQLDTVITLPSSRSLEPVELGMQVDVDEIYMTPQQFENRNELIQEEEVLILENDVLNLREAVEDHILLSIPLQIFTEEEMKSDKMPSGEYWEIVSETEYENKKNQQKANELDPRLAKLSALLDNDEESENK